MSQSEIEEIADRLTKEEKELAVISGAFPMWVRVDYDLDTEDITELIEKVENRLENRNY